MTKDIAVLNISGRDQIFLDTMVRFIDTTQQVLLGSQELGLESRGGVQSQRHKGQEFTGTEEL